MEFRSRYAADYSPGSNDHGAKMGPIRGRQDPGGPHIGPMNIVIWKPLLWPLWTYQYLLLSNVYWSLYNYAPQVADISTTTTDMQGIENYSLVLCCHHCYRFCNDCSNGRFSNDTKQLEMACTHQHIPILHSPTIITALNSATIINISMGSRLIEHSNILYFLHLKVYTSTVNNIMYFNECFGYSQSGRIQNEILDVHQGVRIDNAYDPLWEG